MEEVGARRLLALVIGRECPALWGDWKWFLKKLLVQLTGCGPEHSGRFGVAGGPRRRIVAVEKSLT
jgi:hypothetical protein